jgi:hypothetical protein
MGDPDPVFADRVGRAVGETVSAVRRLMFGNDYPVQ